MYVKFEKKSGFSLVELLVCLSVIAVFLSIAVPGFSYLVSWYRAESAVNEFSSGIERAKYLAVRKGCTVKISVDLDGDGAPDSGFCIYIDHDENNKISQDDEIIYRCLFKGVTINGGKTTIDGSSKPLNFYKTGFVKGGTLCIEMPAGKNRLVTLKPPSGKISIITES
ncbi:MAG: Tfp pilus assembly protein FimT/FimU [Desulfobacteraceae bacterium]|jgi:prepilin-type N-terminal cleavage/methylation domain-containing protein